MLHTQDTEAQTPHIPSTVRCTPRRACVRCRMPLPGRTQRWRRAPSHLLSARSMLLPGMNQPLLHSWVGRRGSPDSSADPFSPAGSPASGSIFRVRCHQKSWAHVPALLGAQGQIRLCRQEASTEGTDVAWEPLSGHFAHPLQAGSCLCNLLPEESAGRGGP